MRYLTLGELLEIHARLIRRTGGVFGVRNLGALQSALAQPKLTFGGRELYPTIIEKAAALGFSLIKNHPFVDGNKRVGHAAIEMFLLLNGYELTASVDDQETVILKLAAGQFNRAEFVTWLAEHIVNKNI